MTVAFGIAQRTSFNERANACPDFHWSVQHVEVTQRNSTKPLAEWLVTHDVHDWKCDQE
jgi:hypothetical protein